MPKDVWLPKGYRLFDGSTVRSLLFSGEDWQIFNTQGERNILLALPGLAQRWCETGFVDASLLENIAFGSACFRSLSSQKKYAMIPIEIGKSPDSKVDAIAFALALKESRKLSKDVSFHDALYIEQYSKLLPTWTLAPHVEDEVVLGTWITGGVVISTRSFRRLSQLAGWIPTQDLAEIVNAAGLHVPTEARSLTKSASHPRTLTDEKTTSIKDIVQPDRHQTSEVKRAQRTFTLPGRPQLEMFFNEHVIDIILNPDKYKVLSIDFPSAIVLHGPPGCGKTFAVERLVDFIDWPSYSIDSNSVGSPYIHATSKKISEIFDKAIDSAPSVIIIDEMESFLSDRQTGGSANMHHVEEVAEFLKRIPEAINRKVLIIAMTNMIDMIDPAILRRGRFDHIIEIGMPSRIEVASLLDSILSKLPRSKELDLEMLLDALTGKPLSDSAFVIREAARIAARSGRYQIDQDSMNAALKSLPEPKENKARKIGFFKDN